MTFDTVNPLHLMVCFLCWLLHSMSLFFCFDYIVCKMLKPQSIRGTSPPGPLKVLCTGPAEGLKRPPDPSSFSCAPLSENLATALMTVSTKGVGTNYWDESYIIQFSFRANLNKIQYTHLTLILHCTRTRYKWTNTTLLACSSLCDIMLFYWYQ